MDRIYVQTNDAERNEVVAFDRAADGKLTALGHFDTGGRGSGTPHLASQSSVVVNGDRLLVTERGQRRAIALPRHRRRAQARRAASRAAAATRRASRLTAGSPTC